MKNKLKFMKRMDDLSDEEISQHMDFDGLLTKQHAMVRTKLYWTLGVIGVAVVVGLLVLMYRPAEKESMNPSPLQVVTTPTPASVDSVVSAPIKDQQFSVEKAPSESSRADRQKISESKPKAEVSKQTYHQAEPVDGYPSLYEYFNSNLVYPRNVPDTIQGVVTISFVINVDGAVESISVQNSLGEPFEKEAIRLVHGMPRWKPATFDNTPVASKISLPLTFQVEKK